MDPSTADVVLGISRDVLWTVRFLVLCVLLQPLVRVALARFDKVFVQWKGPRASFSGELSQTKAPTEHERSTD